MTKFSILCNIMTSEQHSKISESDIWYILENPWEKSKGEWLLGSESERQQTLEFIKNRLASTQPDGFSKIWKTTNNEPIALLGAFLAGPKKYETFLICSKHMEKHSLKLSFEMRSLLREHAVRFKGYTMVQYAVADKPEQISWFRFFGFTHQPEGDRGNMRYFEFKGPAK